MSFEIAISAAYDFHVHAMTDAGRSHTGWPPTLGQAAGVAWSVSVGVSPAKAAGRRGHTSGHAFWPRSIGLVDDISFTARSPPFFTEPMLCHYRLLAGSQHAPPMGLPPSLRRNIVGRDAFTTISQQGHSRRACRHITAIYHKRQASSNTTTGPYRPLPRVAEAGIRRYY